MIIPQKAILYTPALKVLVKRIKIIPTSTCELSAPARSFSQPWNVIMSTLVFPSTSLLVLHGTVVALQENRFLKISYISKYSLNAPQHSSPPGIKAILR